MLTRRSLPLLLLAAASMAPVASALIVTDPPPAADPRLSSALDAIGRWGNNAAAVAVADGWVLTTRHQDRRDAVPNRSVVFGGRTLTALAGEPDGQRLFTADAAGDRVDLRLVRVVEADGTPARFASTLGVAEGPVTEGAALTLAGFGPARGTRVEPSGDDPGGYDLAAGSTASNRNGLRSGTNDLDGLGVIERGEEGPASEFENMSVLEAVFDDLPGTAEASAGIGDSGGFWLVGDAASGYQLAGLTHAVELTRDLDPDPEAERLAAADAFFGQVLVATDVTPFAQRINAVPEPAGVGLLGAGLVLTLRRRGRAS